MKLLDRLWMAGFLTIGFFAMAAVVNSIARLGLFEVLTHPVFAVLVFGISFAGAQWVNKYVLRRKK